jgi:MFS family permease
LNRLRDPFDGARGSFCYALLGPCAWIAAAGRLMQVNFILILAVLNQTGARAGRVVLALYALHLGASPLTVGVLAATFSAFPMMLSVPAGKLADRFGSRWLLMLGAVGGGLGMLVPYFNAGQLAIFVAAAMLGASSATYNVSLQNLVGLLSNAGNRAKNFSNYSLTASVSNFSGPLVAGFSIDHLGYGPACLGIALLAIAPLTLLTARGAAFPSIDRHEKQAKGSIRDMLLQRGVQKTLATSSLLHSASDLFQFYIPIYGHGIGLAPSAIGMVLSMNAAAAFVVRTVLPRMIRRFSEERVLAYAFFVGAVSFLLVPFFHNGILLALVAFMFGLGMGCGQPIVTMLMFGNAPEGRSGEALGLRMTVNHLTRVIGPLLFGTLASAFGLPSVFWVNSAMLASGAALSHSGRSARGRTSE